tara:strand:- start:5029 stop:7458 length:2430 start_codon:yes stop_codon:yes gene_type:complete
MAKKDSNCKACDEKNSNALPKSQIASFASNNNMTGALTASFGTAVDSGTASKLGTRFGSKSSTDLMKFIETPGSNKQKRNMTSDQKSKHLINSVGLGNFGLNSTLESGIIGSVTSARGDSSSFLKGDKTGNSLIAASALGIDVPNGDMLGIGPNDSPMFKLFKLAGFGLKMLCASLKGKQRGGPGGFTSDTEQALGLILSIGINLDLLARLKSIFDKLLNLKANFSSFGVQDLNIANSLFNLCDWVENMEYGSDTIDSFRKTFANTLTNKGLTEAVGKNLISNGTYDTYAKNDFGFDQQFKSIAGDIDMLKCDACKFGQTDIRLGQGNETIAQLEFDPRTGLNRELGYDDTSSEILNNVEGNEDLINDPKTFSEKIKETNNLGGVDYNTNNKSVEFVSDKIEPNNANKDNLDIDKPENEIKKNLNVEETKFTQKSISAQVEESKEKVKTPDLESPKSEKKSIKQQLGIKDDEEEINSDKEITTKIDEKKIDESLSQKNNQPSKVKAKNTEELESEIKKDAKSSHQIREEEKSGIEYESKDKTVVYDTYTDENGDIKEDKYEKEGDEPFKKTKSTTKVSKPVGGPPAEQDADEVKSFHTGETIKREELKGTVLEDADMNAVGLLHPNDLKNLKDTEQVTKTLEDAEKIYDKTFAEEIEKTENLVLSEQTDGIIFGAQLPTLNGNQIVINSERILISAKTQECGIFSKRKFFVSTDDEITMNAKQRIVLKTDMHTSIESPTIHLGVYTTRNHPSLKGDCTVWWLQDLCDWLSGHTHSDPWVTTGTPTQQGSLAALRARAPTLLSERIFISG